MITVFATSWEPSTDLLSAWVLLVAIIVTLAVAATSIRPVLQSVFGECLAILGAPLLFVTVLFSEAGMLILKDGKDYGFPIWARAYPDASDFLATYLALAAGYLVARSATTAKHQAIRFIAWFEAVGFGFLAIFELFLVYLRYKG